MRACVWREGEHTLHSCLVPVEATAGIRSSETEFLVLVSLRMELGTESRPSIRITKSQAVVAQAF